MNGELPNLYQTWCTGCYKDLTGMDDKSVRRHLFWCGLPLLGMMILLPILVGMIIYVATHK